MANRNMKDQRVIAENAASNETMEQTASREDFKSRYVYEAVGVPKNPAVLEAVDKWADVWGDEVITLVNHEGLLDDEIPEQKEARDKLAAAADELAKQLPKAKFMTGLVTFEEGHIQLSGS